MEQIEIKIGSRTKCGACGKSFPTKICEWECGRFLCPTCLTWLDQETAERNAQEIKEILEETEVQYVLKRTRYVRSEPNVSRTT